MGGSSLVVLMRVSFILSVSPCLSLRVCEGHAYDVTATESKSGII
jgi:hypothetical protein